MEASLSDEKRRIFGWQEAEVSTAMLSKQMSSMGFSEKATSQEGREEKEIFGALSSPFVSVLSAESLKTKVHESEVLLLAKALEVATWMEKRRSERYEQLKRTFQRNGDKTGETEGGYGRSENRQKATKKGIIRNEALRANERRQIHQLESEKQRGKKRRNTLEKAVEKLRESTANWTGSLSRELDQKLERIICEARLKDMNNMADNLSVLLHEKKLLREQYFTARREEKSMKHKTLRAARNTKKELLLLPRLQRRRANKKIKSASTASGERVRRLLGREIFHHRWREIQETAYNVNFTRPNTFSYFQGISKKRRRVASA